MQTSHGRLSSCLLQPIVEVHLPTLRQCIDQQRTAQGRDLFFAVPLHNIESRDFGHWNRAGVTVNHLDIFACGDFSLASDSVIKTGPPAGEEARLFNTGVSRRSIPGRMFDEADAVTARAVTIPV